MSRRILALSRYFLFSLTFSLAGLLYLLLGLVFYLIFFDPRQQTPDSDYFILVAGLIGIALSFLVTLSVASRANKAAHFPFLVRLPSRVEYLTAVLLSSLIFSSIIQGMVAIVAFVANGPAIAFQQALVIPPLWLAGNILFIVLALHATDLVTAGWSRVYVFGVIGLLLYIQSGSDLITGWLSDLFNSLANSLFSAGIDSLATTALNLSNLIAGIGRNALGSFFGFVFWPFTAIAEATINGSFALAQALAPGGPANLRDDTVHLSRKVLRW